jgi:archaellum component FlaC
MAQDSLEQILRRLSEKLKMVNSSVEALSQDRIMLEGKIEDAQKRIQHILSRLPEQSDSRQMNLLGAATSSTNPEDDSDPTTH